MIEATYNIIITCVIYFTSLTNIIKPYAKIKMLKKSHINMKMN